MSDEQTRPGSEPQPSAHGVNPRVPLGLESHLGRVRLEWLNRIASRIIETHKPYHDDDTFDPKVDWKIPNALRH